MVRWPVVLSMAGGLPGFGLVAWRGLARGARRVEVWLVGCGTVGPAARGEGGPERFGGRGAMSLRPNPQWPSPAVDPPE